MEAKKRDYVIAIDLDATLAQYQQGDIERFGPEHIGAPIPEAVEKVKAALAEGKRFHIFTARANASSDDYQEHLDATFAVIAIARWCQQHFGEVFPVTHRKLRIFQEIWDDRGRQMIPNTGIFVTELMESLGATTDRSGNLAAAAGTNRQETAPAD